MKTIVFVIAGLVLMIAPSRAPAQESLPFPPTPSASIAGRSIQESVYQPRVEPKRLPADAPNILIILMDDVGPGRPAPTAARSTRRRSIAWRRWASPTIASTPRPCARPRAPHC